MKTLKPVLSVLLVLLLALPIMPAYAAEDPSEPENNRGVHSTVIIDDDPTGGYEGDYVVIYNPATSSSTSYSTGTMTGLIETSVNTTVHASGVQSVQNADRPFKIDVDSKLKEQAETASVDPAPGPVKASYGVGDTKTFRILQTYSPTGSSSVSFECLYVGSHCYIWTPVSSSSNTYPLDEIDPSFAKMAADEFDSKFDLMQSSFGNHTNGSSGDGKIHMLYYNINDGWEPGEGYIAGFFYQVDLTNNGLPILNIDTYPGVYYKNSAGTEYKRMDDTYNTMVHEYQHLINYSNTSGMASWLNECFSAASEEICYPGSSVVSRIQSWENYYYSDNNDWLNPPEEFEYKSTFNLHKGYSMYAWDNNLSDVLALYSQVSFFAQYLFTRFGNSIYRQISDAYSYNETSAITSATGVNCADLVRDFRIAVTANAAQDQYGGIYGFKVQDGYDPSKYHNVQSPWDLLSPIVFTGSSCSIKGGGAITVKPVNGVYNPPSGASSGLKYIGIKFNSHEHTYGPWTSNSNGTHSKTCSGCSDVVTENCTYNDVVTAPTATEQGYTTHTCTACGYSFVDSYNGPLGYTVSFSVPAGVTTPAAMNCQPGASVTLPAAGAPDGYTFLGWVTENYTNVAELPANVLTGSYSATEDITLKALYSHTETVLGDFTQVTEAPDNWEGSYVITKGDTYALKGLVGTKKYESTTAGGTVKLSDAGMTVNGTTLNGASADYVFRIAAADGKFTVQNAATGTYLASRGGYLYSYKTDTANYDRWSFAMKEGAVEAANAASRTIPYLGFSTKNYFMVSRNAEPEICFWKLTGETETTTYTTVIG